MVSNIVVTSPLAVLDTTSGEDRVAYDLRAGTALIHQCCSLYGAWLKAFDDYDVTGLPPGTPVSLTAFLTVDGAVWTDGCGGSGCGGYYGARLIHGSTMDNVDHADHLFVGRTEHHDVLQLPLTIVAGQPERIEIWLFGARSPGGSHGSEAFGVISFGGLGPGMAVVSCQGFAGGSTPARKSSWGRLKAIYR